MQSTNSTPQAADVPNATQTRDDDVDYASLLVERVRRGLHTLVVGDVPVLPRSVALIRVRCDLPGTLAPLERARVRVERLLEDEPGRSQQRRAAVGPSARQRLLLDDASGVVARSHGVQGLVRAFNRLASRAPGRIALVLEHIDRADAETHRMLAAVLRETGRNALWLPLVLMIEKEPQGSFVEVVDALEQVLAAVKPSTPPIKSPPPPTPPTQPEIRLTALDADARRALRAGAVIGHTFDAGLVSRLLDASEDSVLEALQRASDAGFPIRDTGDGFFEMSREIAAALVSSVLPSLRRTWHERLGNLLGGVTASDAHDHDRGQHRAPNARSGEQEQDQDLLHAARHLDRAGQRVVALERRFDAVALLVRNGDIERGGKELAAAMAEIADLPRGPEVVALSARGKVERSRLRWLGVGVDPSFSLSGAFEMALEAKADLGNVAPAAIQADLASLIAGIAYDLGDGASLERASSAVSETIEALLRKGATNEAATLLNDQAALKLRMGRVAKAAELMEKSLDLLTEIVSASPKDDRALGELAETRHLLARLPLHGHQYNGDLDDPIATALGHAREALEIYEGLGRRREIARVCETIARVEARRGHTVEAREGFLRAMRLADEVADLTGLARCTAGLAELMSAAGQPEDALVMLSSSIELNRSKGSPIGLSFDEQILDEVERVASASGHALAPAFVNELARARARLVSAIEETASS